MEEEDAVKAAQDIRQGKKEAEKIEKKAAAFFTGASANMEVPSMIPRSGFANLVKHGRFRFIER